MVVACEHAVDVIMLKKEEDGDENLLLDDTDEANTTLVPVAITGDQDVALAGVQCDVSLVAGGDLFVCAGEDGSLDSPRLTSVG